MKILLLLIIAIVLSASIDPVPNGDCLVTTYTPGGACWYQGYPVTYTVGSQKIMLTGNIPSDRSWDKRPMILYGHLVENNKCTMLFVESHELCFK